MIPLLLLHLSKKIIYNFIFVVQGNIAKEKQVKLGIKTDKYIEIQSGLSKGKNIVILGNYELKNDMEVRIIPKLPFLKSR